MASPLPFASGDVLTAANLNKTPGLYNLADFTFSSSTVVNVDLDGFNSYLVKFDKITSTVTQSVYLRFGSNATSYYQGSQYILWNGTTSGFGRTNSAEADFVYVGSSDRSCQIWIDGLSNAERTKFTTQAVSENSYWHSGGVHAVLTAYTLFQIFVTSGTISGRCKAYGYNP